MATLLTIGNAVVDASCIPNRPPTLEYEDTGFDYGRLAGIDGVSATLENYEPYVPCGGFSYTWMMLLNDEDLHHYAQWGLYKASDESLDTVHLQWSDPVQHDLDFGILDDVYDDYN